MYKKYTHEDNERQRGEEENISNFTRLKTYFLGHSFRLKYVFSSLTTSDATILAPFSRLSRLTPATSSCPMEPAVSLADFVEDTYAYMPIA